MVRNYVRKTERRAPPIGILNAARDKVRSGTSVRRAADDYGIQFMTLWRHCHADGEDGAKTFGYKKPTVMSPEMERKLAEYLEVAGKLSYGLTARDTRKFAFEFASRNNLRVPKSWTKRGEAGVDWLRGFLSRQTHLSLRKPQATSLARSSAFNRITVGKFFDQLAVVYDRYNFEPKDIWNMDETGITTCQVPQRVIAKKGSKQVSGVTSAERGTLVTVAAAINAVGNCVPAHFVFPRVRFQEHFLIGGSAGCTGSANPSGWMTATDFLSYIRHFQGFTRSSPEKPCLLILDNHASHVSVDVIDFCKEHGIVLLTIPPHTSHRLQPLDRTVYGPLKSYVNASCDAWMRTHPGRTMTIYDIPGVVKEAIPRAASCSNICKGFACTGIYPYNRNIFDDDQFLPSSVTDRPDPQTISSPPPEQSNSAEATVPGPANEVAAVLPPALSEPAGTAASFPVEMTSERSVCKETSVTAGPSACRRLFDDSVSVGERQGTSGIAVTPDMIRQFPKAEARKQRTRKRTRTSEILTDTPVRNRLKEEAMSRTSKGGKRACKTTVPRATGVTTKTTSKVNGKRKAGIKESGPNDNDVNCLICGMRYMFSREEWIQCQECKKWACMPCTDVEEGQPGYVCEFCRA